MRRLLAEPLLHFALLGGAVFAVHAWTRAPAGDARRERIVISADEVRRLVSAFEQTRGRPPTPEERKGLLDERVREEVLYREAIAAGLGEDDPVVRRRMRQKLEFLLEDITGQAAPTDVELQAFLDEHADRFRTDARLSFRQVCFRTDRRADARADAVAALEELARVPGTEPPGDAVLMVETTFPDAPEREVERVFGAPFVRALADAPVGAWTGPIRSGYGWHLVRIASRAAGAVPPLDQARDAVLRAWSTAKREETNEALARELRAKYDVVVEGE